MSKTALVQLAAGNGNRCGGDKLSECYQGKTLFEHSAGVYSEIDFCYKVLVAREKDLTSLQPIACYYDEIVFNPHPEDGISSSIRYGIDAVLCSDAYQKGEMDSVLFSVSDQPNLKTETIKKILTKKDNEEGKIIAPRTKSGKRGNPVLFPVSFLSELYQLQGDTGGNMVIKKHPELLRIVETDDSELFDVDRKEDIKGICP